MQVFLTIVNRAEDANSFVEELSEELPDNYTIQGVHSLGEHYEADDKERFIGFIVEEVVPDDQSNAEVICHFLRAKGYGAHQHENLEEAIEFAQEKYKFEDDDAKRQENLAEVRERYPYFTAKEWESFQIFDAMYHTGKLSPVRGRYNDELVVVLASIANGADEVLVEPRAIIINDKILEDLNLPFEEIE